MREVSDDVECDTVRLNNWAWDTAMNPLLRLTTLERLLLIYITDHQADRMLEVDVDMATFASVCGASEDATTAALQHLVALKLCQFNGDAFNEEKSIVLCDDAWFAAYPPGPEQLMASSHA